MMSFSWADLLAIVALSAIYFLYLRPGTRSDANTRRSGICLFTLMIPLALVMAALPLPTWSIATVVPQSNWSLQSNLSPTLLLVWLIPTGLLISLHLARWGSAVRRLNSQPPLQDPRIRARLISLTQDSIQLPRLKLSQHAPAALSLPRPTILLPENYCDWDTQKLDHVLEHELIHLRRKDDVWQNIISLVCCLVWWVPGITLLRRRFVEAAEESCDDYVCENTNDPYAYGSTLVSLVSAHQPTASQPISPEATRQATSPTPHMGDRVRRLANQNRRQVNHSRLFWLTLQAVGAVTLISTMDNLPAAAEFQPKAPSLAHFTESKLYQPAAIGRNTNPSHLTVQLVAPNKQSVLAQSTRRTHGTQIVANKKN